MTTDEFEALVLAEGYSPATSIERAIGYSLDEHQHSFDACALILSGDITLVVDGVARTYAAGDIFRLAAGTVHLERAGPAGVAYLSARRELVAP